MTSKDSCGMGHKLRQNVQLLPIHKKLMNSILIACLGHCNLKGPLIADHHAPEEEGEWNRDKLFEVGLNVFVCFLLVVARHTRVLSCVAHYIVTTMASSTYENKYHFWSMGPHIPSSTTHNTHSEVSFDYWKAYFTALSEQCRKCSHINEAS